jgi:hypothetical protein
VAAFRASRWTTSSKAGLAHNISLSLLVRPERPEETRCTAGFSRLARCSDAGLLSHMAMTLQSYRNRYSDHVFFGRAYSHDPLVSWKTIRRESGGFPFGWATALWPRTAPSAVLLRPHYLQVVRQIELCRLAFCFHKQEGIFASRPRAAGFTYSQFMGLKSHNGTKVAHGFNSRPGALPFQSIS